MFGIHDYALFAATAFLLNLTPGPDTMYILGRSLAQGRRSGFASVFGISTGCLVHTIAAGFWPVGDPVSFGHGLCFGEVGGRRLSDLLGHTNAAIQNVTGRGVDGGSKTRLQRHL